MSYPLQKKCFFSQLRPLIPLNYLSPLIRFFKPLNPLILYTFFASSCCYAPTRTHSRTARRQETKDRRRETDRGNVRQETWGRICETVRRSETDRRHVTGKVRQKKFNRQEMWHSWCETGDRRRDTRDARQTEVVRQTGYMKQTGGVW